MRLRRRTTLLLVFAVLLLLAFGYGWHAWRSLLREQGVERLEWQGLGLSAEGIGLRRLALERRGADGASLRLDVEHALLRWPGLSGWRPRLPGLRVEQVALAWQPAAASSDDDSAALDWTSLRETLAWLPEQIHLERFHLDLPCPAGRCEQEGGLDIGRPSGALFPLAAQLRLQQEAQQAQLDAQLFEEPTGWRLRARAQLDRQALLTLDSQLAPSDGDGLWQGRLEAPGLPDTRGLVVWLNRWLPEAQRLPDAPQALRLQADWTIRLAPGSDWLEPRRVLDGGGSAALLVQAPQAWPMPGLGNVQGELQVQLDGDEGAWLPRQLRSDLRLSQLHGEWLQALPAELRPSALGLRSEPLERDADSVTALRLAFASEGASTLKLEARLDLLGISPWAARLVEGACRWTRRACNTRAGKPSDWSRRFPWRAGWTGSAPTSPSAEARGCRRRPWPSRRRCTLASPASISPGPLSNWPTSRWRCISPGRCRCRPDNSARPTSPLAWTFEGRSTPPSSAPA